MTATLYYAFLQARDPITVDKPADPNDRLIDNVTSWELIASGTASASDPEGRLKALRDLQRVIEKQGQALHAWEKWEGSELLRYDYCECGSKQPWNKAICRKHD